MVTGISKEICPECGLKVTIKGVCKLQEIVKLKCSNCGYEMPKDKP